MNICAFVLYMERLGVKESMAHAIMLLVTQLMQPLDFYIFIVKRS